jgi:diguanylate cyclase (GGDEF)-like protein
MTLAPSAAHFPELFPFHWVVDADMVICQMGPAVQRLVGDGMIGEPLQDLLRWHHPHSVEYSLEGLGRISHKLAVVELTQLPLRLKGQLLVEGNHAFFLLTPAVNSIEQLSRLGIRLSDIARHDAMADALVMLQTKDITIHDLVQRRTQDLEQLATRDALTGVGNRLLFNRELAAELKGHEAIGQSLALLLLDVDHFKLFNDSYGHLAGDDCLRAVAQRLVDLVGRAADRVYRYGGEEFAVLLPQTDQAGAVEVARRIVEGFASTPLLMEGSTESHRVTVSAGLACFEPGNPKALTETDLIGQADGALYEAKRTGRSRFVCGDLRGR